HAAPTRRSSDLEDFRLPLHFAAHKGLLRMVELLLELGADPTATDASGFTADAYATTPEIARPVIEAIRARRGPTLLTSVALGDWETAGRLIRQDPAAVERQGVLHLMSKSGNIDGAMRLLDNGANTTAKWATWDSV